MVKKVMNSISDALKSLLTADGFIRLTRNLSRLFRGITSSHVGDF